MESNGKKYPIEDAAEEVLRSLAYFIRRKHDMADALEIIAFVSLFIALILRYG